MRSASTRIDHGGLAAGRAQQPGSAVFGASLTLAQAARDELSARVGRNKQLALLAAIMGSFVAGLDATAVNVALPAIRDDLGGGLAGQQWVSNAYLLTLGSLILIGGSLGDIFGERRVFSIGVGRLRSRLGAVRRRAEHRAAGRRSRLQGAFGALLTPSALALIISTFPAAERGAAIGSWTAWAGIATVIGPLVGGYLVDAVSWRLIFAINVPFVALTLALICSVGARPRAAAGARARVDWLGAVLTFLGLAGPGARAHPPAGRRLEQPAGLGARDSAGVALLGLFLLHERRTPRRCCRSASSSGATSPSATCETFAMYGGLSVTFFFLVLFLQQVAGYDALQAGLALMPATLVMFALSKRIGRLADRVGPRLFMGFGPLIAALGLALMLRIDADLDYFTDLLPALAALRARAVVHGRTADRGRALRRRRVQRRHRVRRQQRDRAHRRPAGASRPSAPSSRAQFNSSLDRQPVRPARSRRRAQAAVERGAQPDVRERRSGRRRPGGGAGGAVGLGARLPRRPRHLGRARRARRRARPGRHPQPPPRRALPGLPGRATGGPAARHGPNPAPLVEA